MNRLPWLHLWSEARNDRKLASLNDTEFRVWFNLLCLASEQIPRGTVSADPYDILALEVSGGNEPLLDEVLCKLQKLYIITVTPETRYIRFAVTPVTCITFIHFEDRNGFIPSATPARVNERVRAFRERKRVQNDNVTTCNVTETLHVTDETTCNVTPVTCNVTPVTEMLHKTGVTDETRFKSHSETLHVTDETDVTDVTTRGEEKRVEERERESVVANATAARKSPVKRFAPPTNEEAAAYFEEQGQPARLGIKFCDHYQASGWKLKGGNAMKDWRSAIREWCAREREGGTAGNNGSQPKQRINNALDDPRFSGKIEEIDD